MAVKEVTNFKVPVSDVLTGAQDAGLEAVALIGRTADGKFYVASSCPAWEALELFAAAPAEIERLSTTDAED